MTFTVVDNQFVGTELMVRKLLADRLFLTKDERDPEDKDKIIYWLNDMTVTIRMITDKSVQGGTPKGVKIREGNSDKFLRNDGSIVAKKSKGAAYSVEIILKNIRHKNSPDDRLNIRVQLVNNNGAFTKWHMSDASNWFKRAMPKVDYAAVIEVADGVELSSNWGKSRKDKTDRDFFLVSASQLNQNAAARDAKAESMKKYNLQRYAMYQLWARSLRAAVRFYDAVRTA